MTPNGKLQVGDTVRLGDKHNGKLAIVLNVGKSSVYSIQVFTQDKRLQLLTEVPYWLKQGGITYVNRVPQNVGWAKGWRYSNPNKLLDL